MKNQTWLTQHIPQIITALFVIQPIMDVISYWFQVWGLSAYPTLVLRMGILGLTVLLGFLLSSRKKLYFLTAGILAAIAVGHIIACIQAPGGYRSPISDLTNYIRVIQMPVTAICLITFLKSHEKAFDGMQLGLMLALVITLAVEILSVVTGTDPNTYTDGLGTLGWFSNTNSQSNNLSILIPISIAWQLTRKNRNMVLFCLTTILGLLAMFFFCTRLAYLGIYAACIGIAFSIFVAHRQDWKVACVFLVLAVLFTVLLPQSPMSIHMNANNSAQDERQTYINMQIGDDMEAVKELIAKENNHGKKPYETVHGSEGADSAETEPDKVMTEEERQKLIESLTPVYKHYVRDFVEIFGAEKTMEMFDYSIDVRDFASVRHKKLMFASMLMNDSPFTSRLFGLNLARFTVGENIYDVENDFHGVYYLFGLVGLAALLAFIGYFVYLIVWALIRNAKKYYTLEAASYGIAFLMCMAHAYNTAGVLRRPNASIFLSAILAGIYYLVKLKKYQPEEASPKLKAKAGR